MKSLLREYLLLILLIWNVLTINQNVKLNLQIGVNNNIESVSDNNKKETSLDKIEKNDFNKNKIKKESLLETKNLKANSIITLKNDDSDKIHQFNIESLETEILVKSHSSSGDVKEKVVYVNNLSKNKEHKNNSTNVQSITRKISLSGTSDRLNSFKLSSYDVKLISAKVSNNCLENKSSYFYEHPYMCVTADFENIHNSSKFEIEYEYTAENIVKKKFRPYSEKEQENVIIWIYDNYSSEVEINKLKLSIGFENELINHFVSYPEKNFKTVKDNIFNNSTIFQWEANNILPNSYRNFAINVPVFNKNTKLMYDAISDFSTVSIIQLFIWFTIASIVVFAISYLYVKNKSENPPLNGVENSEIDIKNTKENKMFPYSIV